MASNPGRRPGSRRRGEESTGTAARRGGGDPKFLDREMPLSPPRRPPTLLAMRVTSRLAEWQATWSARPDSDPLFRTARRSGWGAKRLRVGNPPPRRRGDRRSCLPMTAAHDLSRLVVGFGVLALSGLAGPSGRDERPSDAMRCDERVEVLWKGVNAVATSGAACGFLGDSQDGSSVACECGPAINHGSEVAIIFGESE